MCLSNLILAVYGGIMFQSYLNIFSKVLAYENYYCKVSENSLPALNLSADPSMA